MFTPFAFVKDFTPPVQYMVATGGTVTTVGNIKTHTFTGNDDFIVTSPGSASVFLVGGGGGGGSALNAGVTGQGGGGGGGGIVDLTSYYTSSTYSIVIGGGGEEFAEEWDVAENRDAVLDLVVFVGDQATQHNGLIIEHRGGGDDFPGGNARHGEIVAVAAPALNGLGSVLFVAEQGDLHGDFIF